MLRFIVLSVIIILGGFVFFATFYFWISVIKGKKEILKDTNNIHYLISLGSLLGIGTLFYLAFNGILFFIPDSWGNIDKDGDFISFKSSLAIILSFFSTVFLHTKPFKFIEFLKSKDD